MQDPYRSFVHDWKFWISLIFSNVVFIFVQHRKEFSVAVLHFYSLPASLKLIVYNLFLFLRTEILVVQL